MTLLTPHRQRVLEIVARGPGTVEEITHRCDWRPTRDSVYRRLRALEDGGLVRRSDERKDGSHVWQATGRGRDALA